MVERDAPGERDALGRSTCIMGFAGGKEGGAGSKKGDIRGYQC